MKKIWLIVLALVVTVSLGANPVAAQQQPSDPVVQQPLTDRQLRINANVADISNRHQQKIGAARHVAQANAATGVTQDVELYAQQVASDCMKAIQAYLESEGLVNCGQYSADSFVIGDQSTSSDVSPLALASDLTVYQGASKDTDGSIYYYAYWDWTNGMIYDALWDTYDLVSAQLHYDNGWRWRSMECQTWDQYGNETGFTDGNSWNTRGDGVTLRSDFWQGKIFNLYDQYNPVTYAYKTDTVRIAGWITPGSTATNEVKSDFEHNWRTIEWGASITSANFIDFNLQVQYTNAHYHWMRGSNAKAISK